MRKVLRALSYFRADQAAIAGVLVLLLAGLILNVLKPWPLALLVDHVLGKRPFPEWLAQPLAEWTKPTQLLALVAAMLSLHLGQALIASGHTYLAIRVGLRGLTRVRNEVFACLQRLSLRFHHGSRTGDLIFRAATDTHAFHNLFQHVFLTGIASAFALLFIVAVMGQVNRPLTFLALGLVPLLMVIISYFGRQMHQRGLEAQKAESTVTSLIQQGVLALPLIQSYTREDRESSRFGASTARASESRLSQYSWEVLYGLMVSAGLALGTASITWLGARQVLAGRLTLGELLVFLAYLTQMFEPLNQLSYVGRTVASATVGLDRVFEILDTPEEIKDRPQARPIRCATRPVLAPLHARQLPSSPPPLDVRGQIQAEHVSFAYAPPQEVLRDVSFRLEPGEPTVLIGPSGSGKTTLLNLLLRFFDPNPGVVLLDGVDLRDLRVKDLRAHVALLLQEPLLLPASVAENIAYGRPGASLAEIQAAAQAAHADVFIRRLSRRYDTVIGESAALLSVGEKQRINLARAFLKDAPILLLDEPTSALDAESEGLILASLDRLTRDRTTLMVAHRLATIGLARQILVLEEGRLTESGSPNTLARSQGYYARLLAGPASPGSSSPASELPARNSEP